MSLYMGEDKITPILLSEAPSTVVEEKDVNFYDYDGTLLYSYTKNEFLALNELPSNPTHTGLTAQGWNWDLSDAKSYVTDYGILDVGQVYTTASGLSEFDIELTPATGLSVNLNMNGTKNWGDGTSDTTTSHTYSTAGKYTITCDGNTMTTSKTSGLFSQSYTNKNYYVKNIRISNLNAISQYAFCHNYSLENIIIPNSVTIINNNCLETCYLLKIIIIPNSITAIKASSFSGCTNIKKIIIPNSVTSITRGAFKYNYVIKKIIIPNSVTSIEQEAFQYYYSMEIITIPKNITTLNSSVFAGQFLVFIYNFSKFTQIPTLSNTNAFEGINKLAKIIVPDSLYTDWIETSNWSTYASQIVKESDYSGS